MKESPLRNKSLDFAVRVVQTSRTLREEKREFALADQFLRSGTSIGANLSEAAFAPSSKDFLNKCKISLDGRRKEYRHPTGTGAFRGD